jgi:5-methylcytosine-specific restriction endonuclease McrA
MTEHYIPAELRRLVTQRAGNRCEYCGAPADYSSDTFTFDHIVPRSLGGPTTADNLALACFSCNQHKAMRLAALDPATGVSVPLFNPRQQKWDEHFA